MTRHEFEHAIRAAGAVDVDFCRALVARRLVDATILAERLAAVKGLDAHIRSAVAERIRALRT